MKYVPESFLRSTVPSIVETQPQDDYETSDGDPVESRPALMFLDTQPPLENEPLPDEQNDDSPADTDDGQMIENDSSSQSQEDKAP